MLTFRAGSRKVNSGWSGEGPHGCQSTVERRLLGLCGIVALPVMGKFDCNRKHINVTRLERISSNEVWINASTIKNWEYQNCGMLQGLE